MSMTLLEMTQNILASMDSDQVNSIADTAESQQVAQFIKDSYEYLMSSVDLNEHYTFFELVPTNNVLVPNLMYLPDNCDEVLWVKYDNYKTGYDNGPRMEFVNFIEQYDFFDRMQLRNSGQDNVAFANITSNSELIPSYYYIDRHPSEYTVFNDRTLIFDAIFLEEDSTLQKSKSMAYGKLRYDFSLTDNFVPNLNNKHFSLLFNEAKSQAFIELKQQANPIAERRLRKGWIRSQHTKDSVQDPAEYYRNLPNFGRRK